MAITWKNRFSDELLAVHKGEGAYLAMDGDFIVGEVYQDVFRQEKNPVWRPRYGIARRLGAKAPWIAALMLGGKRVPVGEYATSDEAKAHVERALEKPAPEAPLKEASVGTAQRRQPTRRRAR